MSSGAHAERVAADYLRQRGFKIIATNWRTRRCEIDIVAQKDKRVYFVEIKYRQSADWGSGLDYITPAKLKQMRFAAAIWVQNHKWAGDYSLAAIEVSGPSYSVDGFVSDI